MVFVVFGVWGVGRAEPPPMSAAAKAQLERGLRAYAVGKYAEAIGAFQDGYQIEPRPELLYALAQAQRLSGDCRSASASYRAFLRTAPPASQAGPAQANLERCEREVALKEAQKAAEEAAEKARKAAQESNEKSALPPQVPLADPTLEPAPVERRPWYRDPAGAALVSIGIGFVGVGGALWGVGGQAIDSVNAATTYDVFARRTADAAGAEAERAVGITGVAVGGALIVAGVIRWAVLLRHHR